MSKLVIHSSLSLPLAHVPQRSVGVVLVCEELDQLRERRSADTGVHPRTPVLVDEFDVLLIFPGVIR